MPHHDFISRTNNMEAYVLLINLNKFDISTNFWEFNGKKKMDTFDYINFSTNFMKNNENTSDLKMPKEIKIYNKVSYKFNEAIVYNASLLHNASIIKNYTRDNPRITLNYMFYVNIKNNNICKIGYV